MPQALAQSNPASSSRAPPQITCIAFKQHRVGGLLGFCDFHIRAYRLRILGCAVHRHANGRMWVSLPGKPQLNQERELARDPRGKILYTPVIAWDGDHVRDAFSEAALEALAAYDPSFDSDE